MAKFTAYCVSVLTFTLASIPSFAFALTGQQGVKTVAAPELDPSSAAAVVVMLVGIALLAHRRTVRA